MYILQYNSIQNIITIVRKKRTEKENIKNV